MKQQIREVGVVSTAALALILAGCGNDVEPEATATSQAPSTTEAPTTTAQDPSTDAGEPTTTSSAPSESLDVSGVGYHDAFRFELVGAELGTTSINQPGLLVQADLENLNEDADASFSPQVALEGPDGTAVDGRVTSERVPSGSSGSAEFEFESGEEGIDSLDGLTLLVGPDGEAQTRLALDGSGESVSRAPVELEADDPQVSAGDVEVEIDEFELRWYDVNFNQVGDDEIVLFAEISATNGTEGQTCVRDAISFIGPDDDRTGADGRGDCIPAGESEKGTGIYATIEQAEAGEWTFEVAGDWGTDGEEVTGEITFELTEEMLSGAAGEDGDASQDDDATSDDEGSGDDGSEDGDASQDDESDSSTTDVTTSSDSEDNGD